ncbi:MAG: alpha/beta hydrolase [Bdellovibrionota bacterium]|nr:hypothetical protein [Pseudobdellovibrionaceae bacterium]|tara:strand:- start:17342 stop:18079 length:738 start_codon:yes stop_codon:yes gene_type:complete
MNKILLLRGLGREKLHWNDEFLNSLKRKGLEPICIDHPGAGDYRQILSPIEIEDYVAFLQTQFEELGLSSEKIYLLGHSLGGMVALRWAYEYPEQFHKVFLLNTSDGASLAFPLRLKPFGLRQIFKILSSNEISKKETEVLNMISNSPSERDKYRTRWIELAARRPIKSISLVNQVIAASRFQAPKSLEIPAVYLCSTADKMVSHKCSEKLAKLHKAKIYKHDKGGHDLALDAPEWLSDQISNNI